MRDRWPLRRTVLMGLGAGGVSVLVGWTERVLAGDVPRAPRSRTVPDVPDDSAQKQRAVLFEEDPADSKGRAFAGTAVWSVSRADEPGRTTPEMVLRANVAIPDRGMTLEWTMRRSTEKLVWASHTVHLVFELPPDYEHGDIQNVPGMLMKTDQDARGAPIIGTAVKVKSGYFLIGLSAADADRQRNLMLLRDRSWLDIPIVFIDERRAILAIEKGRSGERAFAAAFAAWE